MTLWGLITLNCIVGFIWMLVIDLWQAAIPLAALAALFGFMSYRDIRDAIAAKQKA
jgi:hypothetical protein